MSIHDRFYNRGDRYVPSHAADHDPQEVEDHNRRCREEEESFRQSFAIPPRPFPSQVTHPPRGFAATIAEPTVPQSELREAQSRLDAVSEERDEMSLEIEELKGNVHRLQLLYDAADEVRTKTEKENTELRAEIAKLRAENETTRKTLAAIGKPCPVCRTLRA